jgi:deoxyadenosine/deoxycytidine kinase
MSWERRISFKAKDNNRFRYYGAQFDGCPVRDEWLCERLIDLLDRTTTPENVAPMSPDAGDCAVITPEDNVAVRSEINLNDKKRKAEFSDFSMLHNIKPAEVTSMLKFFFNADLDEAVEIGHKKVASNAPAIAAELTMPKEDAKADTTAATATSTAASTNAPAPAAVAPPAIKPVLISIEGNIGAGKSYLLAQLRSAHPEWCFIDEPVDFWESLKNDAKESLLEVFYKDQRRWSYTFQNCALLSRFNNIETAIADFPTTAGAKKNPAIVAAAAAGSKVPVPQVFITERCLDTDHEVFAKMLHSDGMLDNLEYDLYQRWFSLLGKSATKLSAIVYVDTQPTLCSQRIVKRCRDGESGIPIEYLTNLDVFQSRWIDSTNVPTVRTLSDTVEKVESFVDKLIADAAIEAAAAAATATATASKQ